MVQAAVDQLKQIYEVSEEIQRKERKSLSIMILIAFLFVLPGLGEGLAAPTGVAMLARLHGSVKNLRLGPVVSGVIPLTQCCVADIEKVEASTASGPLVEKRRGSKQGR